MWVYPPCSIDTVVSVRCEGDIIRTHLIQQLLPPFGLFLFLLASEIGENDNPKMSAPRVSLVLTASPLLLLRRFLASGTTRALCRDVEK